MGKHPLVRQLGHLVASMAQGSLSEITRACGNPTCACARDPARRHGPHLYWKFTSAGKAYSVYVPPTCAAAVKQAHAAWLRFLTIGARLSARNRQQLLRRVQRAKPPIRAASRRARRATHD